MMVIFKTKKCVIILLFLIIVLFAITECKRGGGGRRGSTHRGSSNVWGRAKQSQNGQANYDPNGNRKGKSQSSGSVPDPNKKVDASSDAQPAPQKQETVKKSTASFLENERKQPSAPVGKESAPPVQKNQETAGFIQNERKQESQQRPIGWDVGQNSKPDANINKNVGWNVGNANPAQGSLAGQQHISPSQTHAAHSYPNTGASNYYGTGTNYNYGNARQPPPYTPYQQNTGINSYGSAHQPPPPYTPNQQYAGTNHYYGNAREPPPPYTPNQQYTGTNYNYGNTYHPPQYNTNAGMGGSPYYNNMNGYGHPSSYGNYYGGTNQGGGMFGNILGGHKPGKHGFGGFGGLGGYGYGGHVIGGYGKRFGGGFGRGFGKNAIRNALIGLLVWNLVSGLVSRPYYVYNYYNNPEKVPQEIPLPANAIVLCPQNVTDLCAPNTAPLCTNNSTIMCVVLAQETVPCSENAAIKCANSTVNCAEGEAVCDGKEKKDNVVSSINIPCITNATITGKITEDTIAFTGTGSLLNKGSTGNTTTLCVTTLALPQPEEEAKQGVTSLCNAENANTTACINGASGLVTNSTVNSTVLIPESSTVQPLAM